MGIYIKGMEMPTSCDDCFLPLRYCPYAMKPNGKCPLVPVPKHGRTIDADALYAVMKKERDRIAKDYGDDDPFVRCLTKYAMSMVLSAPTIIPAEEEIADLCTKGHLHLGYAEEGE